MTDDEKWNERERFMDAAILAALPAAAASWLSNSSDDDPEFERYASLVLTIAEGALLARDRWKDFDGE